jgi:sugar lactone lactonase YvrE
MKRQQKIRIYAYSSFAIMAVVLGCVFLTSDIPLGPASARAQDQLWQELPSGSVDALSVNRQPSQQFWSAPRQYRAFQLNEAVLAGLLTAAPMDFTEAAKDPQNEIPLPMPDGPFARFRFVESPIMAPELAAQFPEIKTYRGWKVDDPTVTMRFARTSGGFHAIVLSPEGAAYITPLMRDDTRTHVSYFTRDAGGEAGACSAGSGLRAPGSPGPGASRQSERPAERLAEQPAAAAPVGPTLRTFRLAVAATAEYTNAVGGSIASAMSNGIIPTVNNVAAVYQRELAVSFTLVGNNSSVIFTNPLTDPYTNGNTNQLIDENQATLDRLIGPGAYDIGHVFDLNSAGGLASFGVVCDDGNEGRGTSGSLLPIGAAFDLLVAHEFGHQFGAAHTFNGTLGTCATNLSSDSAYEPGSGSTIMSYPGQCGTDNIQGFRDAYFNGRSLAAMADYIDNHAGCAMTSGTNNTPPSVTPPFPPLGYYIIPGQTPFALTASATDAEDTNLTYCWEGIDHGSPGPPTGDRGDNPLFRSWLPSTTGTRTFPRMIDLLNGVTTLGETLPTTDRLMTFIVTVRDNNSSGGGFNQGVVQLNVAGNSGPFVVTQPAAGDQALEGRVFTVTWDVAGTNIRPVDTANVRILLSTSNGGAFTTELAASTPNDGSFSFIVPRANTQMARIKVEAVGNVFFNVSPAFTIIPAPTITATNGLTVTQGGSVTAQVARVEDGRDPYNSLTVTASNLPTGVTLGLFNNNGAISATATAACVSQLGLRPITLEVTNSAGLSARTTFDLDVDPNLEPTLGSYSNASVTAGQSVSVSPSAPPVDPNGNLNNITVRTTTPPLQGAILGVDRTTGVVTISTATFTQPRIYEMEVEASDGCGRTVKRTFFLTVLNSPPQITVNPNSPARTTQGGTSTAPATIATVSDPQDAPGSLLVSATAPAGLTVTVSNSNGAVMATATAACSVAPGSHNAKLTVTDTAGGNASATFVVIVDANPPPVLGNYNNTGVTVGGMVMIVPSLPPSDPNNAVTLSVSPQFLPGGGQVTVSQVNGRVTVNTVATTALGVYLVKVFARDACGATVTKGFNLTVRSATCATEQRAGYVADTGNHRIQRFNGAGWSVIGQGTKGSGLGQFASPEAVVASPDGRRIYVADTGNRRIQWSQDGGWTWALFASGIVSQGLALDRDGNLYASDALDSRVIRYPGGIPGASVTLATAGAGAGRVSNPNGLAIDCRMNLYIADTGNNRILVIATADATAFANTGTVVAGSGAGINPAQVTAPQGVAVDNGGRLYVADTGNDRVLLIASAPSSGAATVLCSIGPQPGQVRDPEGVTIAAFTSGPLSGLSSILVSDTNNNRVQGRALSAVAWMLIPPPAGGGPGAGTGQFSLPSKIR